MTRVRVGVFGATGYSGAECVRLLLAHPSVEIAAVTAEQYAGRRLAEVHPYLRGCDRVLEAAEPDKIAARMDAAVCALPENAALACVPALLEKGVRVVDISAAFRLKRADLHQRWYGADPAPELRRQAVYGLTELYRDAVRGAALVANPGCYPTGVLLGVAPLLRAGLVSAPIIADAKSGATGARRQAAIEQLFGEVNENLRPYAIANHRHVPEMEQEMEVVLGRRQACLFAPHLVPVSRGILTTLYVPLPAGVTAPEIERLLVEAYAGEPFVFACRGRWPELREVRGTNRCVIGSTVDPQTNMAIIVTALDNLGKGAAGQAVQNLNVMYGFPETEGLTATAWAP